MTKQELAEELRERLARKGLVPPGELATIDDDGMILAYVTCSECGHVALQGAALELSIRNAKTAEGWLTSWSSHHCESH